VKTFDEQYKSTVTSVTELLGGNLVLREGVKAALKELDLSHTRDIDTLMDEHRKEMKEAIDNVAADQSYDPEAPSIDIEECFLQSSDARAIIERAYRADPRRTTTELNYMGAHGVAGELKVMLENESKRKKAG
jgi:hypothetical protein